MKNSSLKSLIIKKYLKFDKTQPFISISAILAFLGVTVGVMVLIVAMAIMNGFDKEFERKLFIMNYPLTIYPKGLNRLDEHLLTSLQNEFKELKFSPYIATQAIAKKNNLLEGGMVFGVDYKKEAQINPIFKEALGDFELNGFSAIVGKEIKDNMFLSRGDKLTLIFTSLKPTGFSLMPTLKRFEVTSSFHSGLNAYDSTYIYTSLEALRKILHYEDGTYSGIHVYSENPFEDIKKIEQKLPIDATIVGWWSQNGNFFAALKLEKRALFIVLMLIILIATLNIVSSLLMTIMSRRKEIALLLSLGVSKSEVKKIFFYLGSIIGFSGVIIGAILGGIALFALDTFPIVSLPADVYGTSKLPLELSFLDSVLIIIGSIFMVLLASYYPAKKASKIDVLDVLRNE